MLLPFLKASDVRWKKISKLNKIHVTDWIMLDFIIDYCDIIIMLPVANLNIKKAYQYRNSHNKVKMVS